MNEIPSDKSESGVNASWLIILMAMIVLGLGIAFFVIASREPLGLIETPKVEAR